ncbi:MAG: hypothetical protein AAF696_06965 [Bacteroidota bacterium]
MNNNELSFTELIRILSGNASKALKLKFWIYKNKHPEFEKELAAWEDYIRSFESWEKASEGLAYLHQEWYESPYLESSTNVSMKKIS